LTEWNAQIVRIANVGQDKMCRLWLEIPQEHARPFIAEFGWATFVEPIPVKIVSQQPTEDKAERETPSHEMAKLDKPLEPTVPAGVHNPYSRRAGILAQDKQFQAWLKVPNADYAAHQIRHKCGVTSRKDILPGTDAALRFDLLQSAFVVWRDGPRHGA